MLISPEYQQQQEQLHAGGLYGVASTMYAPIVTQIINRLEITHLLDYGCGSKMRLLKSIKPEHGLKYQGYDPGAGLEELSGAPVPAQMVACIDVLEHIEPEYLDNVLNHLRELTEAILFCSVHTGAAKKSLPDGRNAHLTQQPMNWWLPKLWERFDIQTVQVVSDDEFYVIAYAKPAQIEGVDGTKLEATPRLVVS